MHFEAFETLRNWSVPFPKCFQYIFLVETMRVTVESFWRTLFSVYVKNFIPVILSRIDNLLFMREFSTVSEHCTLRAAWNDQELACYSCKLFLVRFFLLAPTVADRETFPLVWAKMNFVPKSSLDLFYGVECFYRIQWNQFIKVAMLGINASNFNTR